MFILYNCSQNGKFSYGYASQLGIDRIWKTVLRLVIEGEIVGLLGVFDGNINNLYVRLALKKDQI